MSDILIYALGFAAQGLFSARILVQWIKSEKAGMVVNPVSFWILSLAASFLFFFYGWLRDDFSIMLGQIIGYYVYIWNLHDKKVGASIRAELLKIIRTLLIIMPPTLIALYLKDNSATAISSLFRNEGIPVWLIIFGCTGQIIFSFRFLYQIIRSLKNGGSTLSRGFWILSLIGSALIIIYGIIRLDPVIIIGQACGFVSYTRQILLCQRKTKS